MVSTKIKISQRTKLIKVVVIVSKIISTTFFRTSNLWTTSQSKNSQNCQILDETSATHERKTFLRHLRIVLKLSYLDKSNIRCLQDNIAQNNCKCTHRCLGITSTRRLFNTSTSDISITSFKDVF